MKLDRPAVRQHDEALHVARLTISIPGTLGDGCRAETPRAGSASVHRQCGPRANKTTAESPRRRHVRVERRLQSSARLKEVGYVSNTAIDPHCWPGRRRPLPDDGVFFEFERAKNNRERVK
jgi:hypothetical protein